MNRNIHDWTREAASANEHRVRYWYRRALLQFKIASIGDVIKGWVN